MLRPESEALQRPFGARFGARLGACFGAPSDVRFSIVVQRPVRGAVRCAVQHAVRRLAGRAGSGWLRTVPFADRGVMRSVEVLCVRPRYYVFGRGTMRPNGAVPESCRHMPGRSSAGRTGGPQGALAPKPKKNGFRPACFDFFPYFCRRFRIATERHSGVATGPGPFP